MDTYTEIFKDDPEMQSFLEKRKQIKLMKDSEIESLKTQTSQLESQLFLEILRHLKGEKGDSPTPEELLSLIYPLIPEPVKGDKGDSPVKGVDYFDGENAPPVDENSIVQKLIPFIPPPVEGKPGKSVKVEEVLSTIQSLKGKEAETLGKALGKMIDISYIRNAQTFMYNGKKYKIEELMHGGGGSSTSSITYATDLSSQCDGINKVFTVPNNTNFVLLTGTDAPIIYKLGTDYTGSGTTTLTLTSQVNAPSSGATLILTYIA